MKRPKFSRPLRVLLYLAIGAVITAMWLPHSRLGALVVGLYVLWQTWRYWRYDEKWVLDRARSMAELAKVRNRK